MAAMRNWMAILTLVGAVVSLSAPGCGARRGGFGGGPTEPGSLVDTLVGAPCRDDLDCDDVCIHSNDFPGGMCSVLCRDDRDCPVGTGCIDREGGICAFICVHEYDCDDFGPGYACRDTQRVGARNDIPVCRG
jgi:hypothetical protein